MTLKSVVLPAPLGPIRPTTSPASTVKETRSSATTPPKRTLSSRTSSSAISAQVYKPTSLRGHYARGSEGSGGPALGSGSVVGSNGAGGGGRSAGGGWISDARGAGGVGGGRG